MTNQPYTPGIRKIREEYAQAFGIRFLEGTAGALEHFDQTLAIEIAAAEQRGAIKALRRVAKDLEWLGAQGNIPTPDTSWQGVLECIRIINSKALTIEYRADQIEGDD